MKSKSTLITTLLVVALLILGIAYAALATQTLTVSGSVGVETAEGNFEVDFIEEGKSITATGSKTASAEITGERTAVITVTGLTTKGQQVVATLPIKNLTPEASDVWAELEIKVGKEKLTEWFDIKAQLDDASPLAPGETALLTITATLLKTPITDEEVSAVNAVDGDLNKILVTVDAKPVQPSAN